MIWEGQRKSPVLHYENSLDSQGSDYPEGSLDDFFEFRIDDQQKGPTHAMQDVGLQALEEDLSIFILKGLSLATHSAWVSCLLLSSQTTSSNVY